MRHFLQLALVLATPLLHAQPAAGAPLDKRFDQIRTVVVIYAENRSFDHLYGYFPGADGIGDAHQYPQRDRDGTVLPALPPVWASDKRADPRFASPLPNRPFRIDAPPSNEPLEHATRDLVHRFYQNQMQIDGGKNDLFAAYSDAGGLSLGHYDGSRLPMWKIARRYTLADHFFMAAFGGSYLNHLWLACACTPAFPEAPQDMRAQLDERGMLKTAPDSPASAMDGPPHFLDGPLTPDGYTVNTMQPTFQPSSIAPEAGGDKAYADPAQHPLPPQTMPTIGDRLSEKHVSWAWYAGGYSAAQQDRNQIYGGQVQFQPHHQPYNYFSRYAPGSVQRALHLKDASAMLLAIRKGTLPQVSFYKPQGSLNEHPGYTSVMQGDIHLARLVQKLQASAQWRHMAIIITYDENGGFYDHVAPPKGDRWGPGSRIPAIVVSPYARRGFVDHTPYDTTSILQFLTKRFKLQPLAGTRTYLGDLSNAFVFGKPGRAR